MLVILNTDAGATTRGEHQAAVRAVRNIVLPRLRALVGEWVANITHDSHDTLATIHVVTREPVPPSCIAAIRNIPGVAWVAV